LRRVLAAPVVGVSAQTIDAAVITRVAASSGLRRPRWSETGPPTSCPSAMPTKNVVNVSWTWVALAVSSSATCGNAGTYMSVASGAIAVRNTTVATSPAVSRAWRREPAVGGTGPAARVVVGLPVTGGAGP
jgi:hypothetical protein